MECWDLPEPVKVRSSTSKQPCSSCSARSNSKLLPSNSFSIFLLLEATECALKVISNRKDPPAAREYQKIKEFVLKKFFLIG